MLRVVFAAVITSTALTAASEACPTAASPTDLAAHADAVAALAAGGVKAFDLACATRVIDAADAAGWPAGVARRPEAGVPSLASWPAPGVLERYAAELLWRAAQEAPRGAAPAPLWKRAADALGAIADDKSLTAAVRQRAALDAVLAHRSRRVQRDRDQLAAIDRALALIDASHVDRPRLLHAKGQWHSGVDQLARARAAFETVLTDHGGAAVARYSAMMLLDVLVRQQDFESLERWVAEMRNTPALVRHPDLAEALERIAVQAARKRAETLEKERKWSACGRAYVEIANAHPKSPYGHEVLYNAGVCFEMAREVGRALMVFEQLRRRYPKSRVAEKALVRSADLYGRIARYRKSAELYERFARRYAGDKLAPSALAMAILYRRALGDDDAVIRDTETYVRLYAKKRAGDAAAALVSLTEVHRRRGRAAHERHLRRLLKQFGGKLGPGTRIHVEVELADAVARQRPAEARRLLTRALRRVPHARRGSRFNDGLERARARHARARAVLLLADLDRDQARSPAAIDAAIAGYRDAIGVLTPALAARALVEVARLEERQQRGDRARAACSLALRIAADATVSPPALRSCDTMLRRVAPHRVAPEEAHGGKGALAPVLSTAPMVF